MLVSSSCRKQLPPIPNADAPVFFCDLVGSTFNLNLKAGINGTVFSDQTVNLNQVKYYSGMLNKQDTTFRLNFFAGEVFKAMNAQDFVSNTTFFPLTMTTETIAQVNSNDWSNSNFDEVSFGINQNLGLATYDFTNPGVYQLEINAVRNNVEFYSNDFVVVGYDNPYKFELQGNVNTLGPGIILEGQILNATSSIMKVEWTCGTNDQTTTGNFVQFPPAGSNNKLIAKVFFSDGTIRTRSIGLGFQNEPKIEDVVYLIETNSNVSFSNKFEIELVINGEIYKSRFATEFSQGQPSLQVEAISLYTDPVTKKQAYMLKTNGLCYFKNVQTNATIGIQLNMQIGLPITF